MTVTEKAPAPAGAPQPPPLSPRELLRWAWRQLTSMRTALLLLLLLALASVPGSVVPQSDVAPVDVARWKEDHPDLATVYDKLGLFSVYDSAWFSAIYLLLMVSLVGCIIPRTLVYLRALRAAPPRAPRNLSRLPSYASVETAEPTDAALARARTELKRRRYRVVSTSSTTGAGSTSEGGSTTGGSSVSGERGYLREAGNLLFHVSVIVVLVGFAYGQLFGYKGGAIVLVGHGFSNSLTQYDEFAPGTFFEPDELPPVSFTVEDFDVEFLTEGAQQGQPVDFGADLSYTERPGDEPQPYHLAVNEPLILDGMSVFLVGHGYAPEFTVWDGTGDVAYRGAVPFLPQDSSFASFGVLKVSGAGPEQLGFDGMFYPTYSFTMERGPFSVFPDALNPAVSLLAYHGDLGVNDGTPQSVYDLDTDELERFEKDDGSMFRADMAPGKKVTLPDGLGAIRLDGWQRWVKLQVSHTPGKGIALTGVVLALVGLMGSLFIRRRRAWVRVTERDGRTYVEVAGLDRTTAGEGLEDEVRALAAAIAGRGIADTLPEDPAPEDDRKADR